MAGPAQTEIPGIPEKQSDIAKMENIHKRVQELLRLKMSVRQYAITAGEIGGGAPLLGMRSDCQKLATMMRDLTLSLA